MARVIGVGGQEGETRSPGTLHSSERPDRGDHRPRSCERTEGGPCPPAAAALGASGSGDP